MSKPYASDYIEVAERLAEFYIRHPEGSLQGSWEWADEGRLIVYRAEAYRTPTDPRPGVGYAQEVFPGKTSFTKGSELMNAETSAWGRAMAALGIATKKGIATGHEVRLAQSRQEAAAVPRVDERAALLEDIAEAPTMEALTSLVDRIKATGQPDQYKSAWAKRQKELAS